MADSKDRRSEGKTTTDPLVEKARALYELKSSLDDRLLEGGLTPEEKFDLIERRDTAGKMFLMLPFEVRLLSFLTEQKDDQEDE
jgi:hypothetical protein